MAFSENATYSATQRFLDAFFDDVDFSKWISVWFYEETRHPHVLVEWLRRVGEPVPDGVRREGPRLDAVHALDRRHARDERHLRGHRGAGLSPPRARRTRAGARGASRSASRATRRATRRAFFRFAWRRLASEEPIVARRSRARGLEVLQAWLGGVSQTTHPVAQMIERLSEGTDLASLDLDFTPVRTRVVRVVGLLLDLPLRREEDVATTFRELLVQARQRVTIARRQVVGWGALGLGAVALDACTGMPWAKVPAPGAADSSALLRDLDRILAQLQTLEPDVRRFGIKPGGAHVAQGRDLASSSSLSLCLSAPYRDVPESTLGGAARRGAPRARRSRRSTRCFAARGITSRASRTRRARTSTNASRTIPTSRCA